MNFDDYQAASAKTLLPGQDDVIVLARMALGLSGESGEVAEKVKKVLRDDNGVLSARLNPNSVKSWAMFCGTSRVSPTLLTSNCPMSPKAILISLVPEWNAVN